MHFSQILWKKIMFKIFLYVCKNSWSKQLLFLLKPISESRHNRYAKHACLFGCWFQGFVDAFLYSFLCPSKIAGIFHLGMILSCFFFSVHKSTANIQYRICTFLYNNYLICKFVKEYIRRMERTFSVNYPVLRQNKRVYPS